MKKTTGELIKDARKKAGLTQAELGAKLNVTPAAISQFEKPSSNPTFETLEKIADALGCKISELCERYDIVRVQPEITKIIDRYDSYPPPNDSKSDNIFFKTQADSSYDNSYSFASSKEEFDKYHEWHQKEEAARKAPKLVAYDENGNEIKDKPMKFTDASTSLQEEQAREKVYNLFNSVFNGETLSQRREEIAIQLGEILTSYNSLNDIGRKAAVESIKGLCYSNAMTESRLDTIYFNRIRSKIENGGNLTPDEIKWKYSYLEKSLKTIGDDFSIFYSMLNREGQEQAYIKIGQALDQIIALTKIPKYQKKPDEPPQE